VSQYGEGQLGELADRAEQVFTTDRVRFCARRRLSRSVVPAILLEYWHGVECLPRAQARQVLFPSAE
jgi:hypothetical protein